MGGIDSRSIGFPLRPAGLPGFRVSEASSSLGLRFGELRYRGLNTSLYYCGGAGGWLVIIIV